MTLASWGYVLMMMMMIIIHAPDVAATSVRAVAVSLVIAGPTAGSPWWCGWCGSSCCSGPS